MIQSKEFPYVSNILFLKFFPGNLSTFDELYMLETQKLNRVPISRVFTVNL